MPTVSQTISYRLNRQARERQFPWTRLGLVSGIFASLLMVAAALTGGWYYLDLLKGLPPVSLLPGMLEPPGGSSLQPTRIYDRSAEQVILTLENPAEQGKQYLRVSRSGPPVENQAAQTLIDATLSALDAGFWTEPGYTLSGIAQGTHPTLAQWLASDLLLDDQPASLRRNIQERLLAMQVTGQYGRSKVLEWYLNSAKYGEFVYGADAAARVYLGKPATQLSIGEAALLTAIAVDPSQDPWAESQGLQDRQVKVIEGMLEDRYIDEAEARQALVENIHLQPRRGVLSRAPEFTNLVLHQLSTRMPLERVYRGGYTIVTTLDADLQSQAACATQHLLDYAPAGQGIAPGDVGEPCAAVDQLPALASLSSDLPQGFNASVAVLDPQVGQILAWVGGTDSDPKPALPDSHPAGSVLAPFIYLTAFTQGMSPASMLWDLPQAGSGEVLSQTLTTYHGPVQLRTALANDYVSVDAQLLQQLGSETVRLNEKKFGVTAGAGSVGDGPVDGQSSPQVSLLDSLQAYGVLANRGVMAGQRIASQAGLSPSAILRVAGLDGRTWLDWSDAQVQPIVSEQLAYLVTDVLADENVRPAGVGELMDFGRPAAVKMGVDQGSGDGWTIGYIPQLAVGVWVGAPAERMEADIPASLWHAVMEYASARQPVLDFTTPEGITQVQVCVPSGKLVSPACPAVAEEVFLPGSEPTQADDLYQDLSIDTQTGRLATIFTPAEQVERQSFLVVPPEAKNWALANRVPLPPDTYDELPAAAAGPGEESISAPGMSGYVKGAVDILGTASGENFSYYRLEAGQGLNPQGWVQIGDNVSRPVVDGQLGRWDTHGLEGWYVVQLLVVQKDQRFERAYVAVYIDGTAPQVKIQAPVAGSQLSPKVGEPIVLQADVVDEGALQRVEFLVDGELVSTLYAPPYIRPWQAVAGTHTLQVIAYDQAGNQASAELKFSVSK